ncbi:nicotinate-nucleotide adenylyltransferase [Hazenella coriacea]|uniref:Probable nicotinate-nucleotide adenylyltransferase n=1 Tax=Hazenella coriacea TaxID=1179467 RepID=A0A4R3L786_9BACL|nr:nicotinate-nucleotide adenylyltransferase [Hazenella coriacea]TCS94800.1 nicotinate-nucleotide adenylyltransferase [Hazenella coriacea]
MKVGIFGGTFDPIHLGHLILADQARQSASLDQVWFIPTGEPPHKKGKRVTSAHHRMKMVELAIANHTDFCLSQIELERSGPSYTIHTIQALIEKYTNYQFFLLIGADMVKDLPHWYKIKEILQFVQVIALGRPGIDLEGLSPMILDRVTWIEEGIETNISSTYIRDQIKQGRSVKYIVPDAVGQYVKEQGLYGS